jgi:hypothetical protein
VTDRGRWAKPAHLLVCRYAGLVLAKESPVARPDTALPARDGSSALTRTSNKRARLSSLLLVGSVPSVRRAKAAEPRGAREADARRLPRSSWRREPFCCEYRRSNAEKRRHWTSMRVQAARLGLKELATAEQSCFSQLKLSEKQAKAIFISERRGTFHAAPSSTLSNSTNGWLAWQRRSKGEDDESLLLRIHRRVKRARIHWGFTTGAC